MLNTRNEGSVLATFRNLNPTGQGPVVVDWAIIWIGMFISPLNGGSGTCKFSVVTGWGALNPKPLYTYTNQPRQDHAVLFVLSAEPSKAP